VVLTGGDDGPRVVRGIPFLAPPQSPPHCFALPCHAIALTRSHDAPCTTYPSAGRSNCNTFVSTTTLTSGDNSARDSSCDSRPNSALVVYLAPRFTS
jgi:hypothetical protein